MELGDEELLSPEDHVQYFDDLCAIAARNDRFAQIVRDYKQAAAPLVARLKEWEVRPGSHFVVSDESENVAVNNLYAEYRYVIRAYDSSAAAEKTQGTSGFEICFYQNGTVVVQQHFLEKPHKPRKVYKAVLRRFDVCGLFGFGAYMPEKLNVEEVEGVLENGLKASSMMSPSP